MRGENPRATAWKKKARGVQGGSNLQLATLLEKRKEGLDLGNLGTR